MPPEKGTVVPLPPSAQRLEEAALFEKPQNFVPATSVNASQWEASGPSRKMMPVGVVGELGSSYTVYQKNWKCDECLTENYASKPRCMRCRARKPAGAGALVHGEAAAGAGGDNGGEGEGDGAPSAAAAAAEETAHGEWKEIFDPAARHLYYFNAATGETQWERPSAMGPTPHASGWFGRGAAGSTAASAYERNNEEYLKRPSRKQVEYIASKNSVLEGAYEYNIWWGKYVGDHWDNSKSKEPAETRCVLATDAGYTKADKMTRSQAQANFCLFFARGCCALGTDCRYFHRIPVQKDLERFAKDEMHDIFGRERHRDFRDDMMGVGAMMKPCRTLYVGGLLKAEYPDPVALEECLWRCFGEWGEVEQINLISRLSICFVRYRCRNHAEFAKEAMSNNHLDHSEILNIRWAHDDPNPVAHEAAARGDADALVNMLKARGVAVTGEDGAMADYDHPADYHIPAPKRLKGAAEDQAYPDTKSQYYYSDDAGDDDGAACNLVSSALDKADETAAAAAAAGASSSSQAQAPAGAALPSGWQPTSDPTTGATYYYHATTGQTSWERPSA